MTRFILHIGPHKTGTTYIQSCLSRNRDRLLRHGIYYPTEWRTPTATESHVGLVEALKRGDEGAITVPLSSARARGSDMVLISSEDLSSLTDEPLQLLRDKFGDHVEVVFYLRRWSEILRSGAQELVLQGLTNTFTEFCMTILSTPYESPVINFAITLDRFSRVFGKDSIKIISYNNVVDEKSDLFLHFVSHVLGRQIDELERGDPIHRSPSIYDSEILRIMNVIRGQRQIEPFSWNAERILKIIEQTELRGTRSAMRSSIEYLGLNELKRPFSDVYEAVTNAYGQNIVRHENVDAANILFERKPAAIPYVQPSYLMYEVVAAELIELFSSLTSAESVTNQASNCRLSGTTASATLDPFALVLEFGRDCDDTNHLGFGWSGGENGFRWMTGKSSELWLENPGADCDYILQLKLLPFIHPPKLPSQRLVVSVRGTAIGRSTLVEQRRSVLRYPLPGKLAASAGPMRLVLEHPDGTKPIEIGRSSDSRELSISLSQLTLLRVPSIIGQPQIENDAARARAPADSWQKE